jgi:streptothricin acetyltransferase
MGSEAGDAVAVIPMGRENAGCYNCVPSRVTLDERLRVSYKEGIFSYRFEELEKPYKVKTYPDDPFVPHGPHAVFFAMAGGECAGQAYIAAHWNGMARIEDIRVAEAFRRKGVGRLLMDAAAHWAKEQGFTAICLETQDNNAAACRFYAAYGFSLGGADSSVYAASPYPDETAIYWYLPLILK